MSAHPDWVHAPGIRADRLIRTRADGWHLVVERLPSGDWIAAVHRGNPDDWASLGRHATEAKALATADGWVPSYDRRHPLRLIASAPAAEPEPEPDPDEAPEPTTPAPTTTDPRQLSLWSRP